MQNSARGRRMAAGWEIASRAFTCTRASMDLDGHKMHRVPSTIQEQGSAWQGLGVHERMHIVHELYRMRSLH